MGKVGRAPQGVAAPVMPGAVGGLGMDFRGEDALSHHGGADLHSLGYIALEDDGREAQGAEVGHIPWRDELRVAGEWLEMEIQPPAEQLADDLSSLGPVEVEELRGPIGDERVGHLETQGLGQAQLRELVLGLEEPWEGTGHPLAGQGIPEVVDEAPAVLFDEPSRGLVLDVPRRDGPAGPAEPTDLDPLEFECFGASSEDSRDFRSTEAEADLRAFRVFGRVEPEHLGSALLEPLGHLRRWPVTRLGDDEDHSASEVGAGPRKRGSRRRKAGRAA